jgi:hypothetical protein
VPPEQVSAGLDKVAAEKELGLILVRNVGQGWNLGWYDDKSKRLIHAALSDFQAQIETLERERSEPLKADRDLLERIQKVMRAIDAGKW